VASWAEENDGIDPKYAVTSSGRLGPNTSLGFDIPSENYAIECKHRKSVPQWLMGAWQQVIEVAEREQKLPLLTVKKNYKPVMHIISPERHAELLKYERKCENDS